ncbi:hypothetical protein FQA39_LY12913 [Lamprigera yunnana]|nr:hypothetical protein FQA39_LY12913 [Lamprigera yunnana]
MHGAAGKEKIVRVPVGTVLIDEKTNKILADLDEHGKEVIVAKAPTIFEAGELGEFFNVKAELKVLADVGFVGLPNAGKSTLLRAISNSRPEVANYAFTTLNPQLGVSKAKNGDTFIVADLPGLIEGASMGKGLGHQFLKHIEQLKKYNLKLDDRCEIIVANKMDLDEAQLYKMDDRINEYFKDKNVIYVSGIKKENTEELLLEISKQLKTAKVYTFTDDDAEDIQIVNRDELVKQCDLNNLEIDLLNSFNTFKTALKESNPSKLALANLKARLRMSACMLLVKLIIIWFLELIMLMNDILDTLQSFGDGGVDIVPLIHLLKSEVKQAAKLLNVPNSIIIEHQLQVFEKIKLMKLKLVIHMMKLIITYWVNK